MQPCHQCHIEQATGTIWEFASNNGNCWQNGDAPLCQPCGEKHIQGLKRRFPDDQFEFREYQSFPTPEKEPS